jgi:Undecaprenyl-phosphate galactose phosphotransferase WbaP
LSTLPSDAVAEPRRTNGAALAKSRYLGRVNGRVRFPEQRPGGNRSYLAQMLRTSIPLALGDLMALTVGVLAAGLFVNFELGNDEPLSVFLRWFIPTYIGLLTMNAAMGLYPAVRMGIVEEMQRLALSLGVMFVMTVGRMNLSSELFLRRMTFALVACVFCVLLMPMVRKWLRMALGKTTWWGFPTLVCGHDAAVVSVYQWLCDHRRLGLRPLGVVASPDALELDRETPGYIGDWSEARAIAERGHAYWAVMVEPPESNAEVTATIEQYLGNVPQVLVLSELTGMPDHWNRHQMNEGLDGMLVEHHLMLPIQQIIKRCMDMAIVIIAGLLLAPMFLALAVIIKLTSRGPVIYGHERVGRGNSRFRAWKFRTMVDNAENLIEDYLNQYPELRDEWERTHKLKNDPRVTAVGRFMRKWSIDELPQLWNVLVGEMSAVGPRPIVPNEIVTYGEHFEIFCSVLPGMTGLWQVCGRNDTSFEERIRLGVYYIHRWSPWLDMYLLGRTVKTVLFSKGAY